MPPVVLADVAATETSPLRKGIILNLLRYQNFLERLTFEKVSSLQTIAVRATLLPSSGFRRINEGYATAAGRFAQVWESVYGFGGDIELDNVFEMVDNHIVSPRVAQVDLRLRSMALTFADYFINGNQITDPDGFVGLKKRIDDGPVRQKVDASSGTTELDPTASVANARRFLTKWEEAWYKAGGGIETPKAIFMNEAMLWGFAQVLRFLGASGGALHDTTKDLFDRVVQTYMGVPMYDLGLKTDQTTEILPVNEDPGDGGNDTTSIYFVPYSTAQGITGIQLNDMNPYDPLKGGERESAPSKLIRIDWWVGLAGFGSYGPTRLHSVEDPGLWT